MTIKKRLVFLFILILLFSTFNSSIATAENSFLPDFNNLITNFQNFITNFFSGHSIFNIISGKAVGDSCKETECEPGTYCTGAPYTVCCPEGKFCCISSTDCQDDLYCGGDKDAEYYGRIGICEPRLGEGKGICRGDRDCVNGLFCNKYEGYICQAEKVKVKLGDTCFNDNECESGNCGPHEDGTIGICCKSGRCCNANNPCPEGSKCDRAAGYYCVEEKKCESHARKRCFTKKIYWVDSCGNLEEIYKECGEFEECKEGRCVTQVISHDFKACFDGDVYWYDSMNKKEDLYQECKLYEECKEDKCVGRCGSHHEKKCSDGYVYWYDSCGKKEGIYDECAANEECKNAECVKKLIKVDDGNTCTKDEDCISGNCNDNVCCLKDKECCRNDGDCSGAWVCDHSVHYCVRPTAYIDVGEMCIRDSDCKSGNCMNEICCVSSKTCCRLDSHCDEGMFCDKSPGYYFCNIKKELGQSCTSRDDCESGTCKLGICCVDKNWGCCKTDNDCVDRAYCSKDTYSCLEKKRIGESCNGAYQCYSGFCDRGTWTCKKPEKPVRAEYVGEVCGEFEDEIINCQEDAFCLPTQKDSYVMVCGKSGTMMSDYACRHDYDCNSGWYCANDYHGEFICLNTDAVRRAGREEEPEPEPTPSVPEPTPTPIAPTTPAYTPPTDCLHPQTGERIKIGETVCGEVLGEEHSMTCSRDAHWISVSCNRGCKLRTGTCCGFWATTWGVEACHW